MTQGLNHMYDMAHSYVRHDSFISVTWLIHMCDYDLALAAHILWDMTHSYVWHVSFMCDVTDAYTYATANSSPRYAWLIRRCDTHDSFICVTRYAFHEPWLIHTCDMTHSYMWHDSYICVIWLKAISRANDMTHWLKVMTWLIDLK